MVNSHLHSRHFGFGDFEQTENTTVFLVFATLPRIKINTWNEADRFPNSGCIIQWIYSIIRFHGARTYSTKWYSLFIKPFPYFLIQRIKISNFINHTVIRPIFKNRNPAWRDVKNQLVPHQRFAVFLANPMIVLVRCHEHNHYLLCVNHIRHSL